MARWFIDRRPQQGIPSVSLRRLLPEARFVGCEDFEISGCSDDSRRLDPGQVFVAVPGSRFDGHAFVAQAIERGAAGVVVERPCPEAGRLQAVVPDSRSALARIRQALAGDPSESLVTMGITGTAGRTVTAVILRAILEAAGGRHGLVGRLGWSDGNSTRVIGAGAVGLADMLGAMVESGCDGGVLELSPETLALRQVEGIRFELAVVTDLGGAPALSPDHLEAVRNASSRLVRQVRPGGAVVVHSDEPACEILGGLNLDADRVSFGLSPTADVRARIDRLDRDGTRFRLLGFDREADVMLRLPGATTLSHALAAAAAARARGLDLDAVVAGIESVAEIPDRLETIHEGQPFLVAVDAVKFGGELQERLRALRSILAESARIHCVTGAEGNRPDALPERRALAAAAE
ncbi:MAG: Mur ligase family protein, partial [Isosphaeraceae bacterium]